MAVIQRSLGILLLLAGVVLLVAGVGAAVYGAMDAQDHQEDQGPLGIGEDEERTQTDQALVTGGIAAAVLGAVLVLTAVILLATARSKQKQQEVVVARSEPGAAAPSAVAPHATETAGAAGKGEAVAAQAAAAAAMAGTTSAPTRVALRGTAASAAADDGGAGADRGDAEATLRGRAGGSPRAALALALVGLLLLSLAAVGLVLANGAGSGDPDGTAGRTIERRAYDGTIAMTGTLGGNSVSGHTRDLQAPSATRVVQVKVDWEPVEGQSEQLQVTVQRMEGSGWRDVAGRAITPGGTVESPESAALDGARIRIVVTPVETSFVVQQSFTAEVAFLR